MLFRHRGHDEAKRLPRAVQDYMGRRFMLVGEYLEQLRCFTYGGVVNDKPVTFLQAFSPSLAREQRLSIKTGADLEQHPEVLLYEGYVDLEGGVHMEDRRKMSYTDTSRRRLSQSQSGP